jgi:hypothetical protein
MGGRLGAAPRASRRNDVADWYATRSTMVLRSRYVSLTIGPSGGIRTHDPSPPDLKPAASLDDIPRKDAPEMAIIRSVSLPVGT